MKRWLLAALLGALGTGILLAPRAAAHKASDSYLVLRVDGADLRGQWDIALRDLDYAIGIDSNDDGIITWGELRARHRAIAAYALSHLELRADGRICAPQVNDQLVDRHSDGAYAVLIFAAGCPAAPKVLAMKYTLLFEFDPQHRGLLRVEEGGRTQTAVFSPDHDVWQQQGQSVVLWHQFLDYFRTGVWHIWTGFDHMLFLCALLLPAVLEHRGGRWRPAASFRQAAFEVLGIVTAFTLAHSLTLSLAVLGVVRLPSRLVESAIALSVMIAALNNLYPLIKRRLWIVAFVFGLAHGLGFANVLIDLGLPRAALAVSLISFNLGVEAGQMAIVMGFLPAAYWMRGTWLYPRLFLGAGSLGIALIASLWLIERSLDVAIFY